MLVAASLHEVPSQPAVHGKQQWWQAPSVGAWLMLRVPSSISHEHAMGPEEVSVLPAKRSILESVTVEAVHVIDVIEDPVLKMDRLEAVHRVAEDPIAKVDSLEAVHTVAEDPIAKVDSMEAGQSIADDPVAKMDRLELVQRVVDNQLERLEVAVQIAAGQVLVKTPATMPTPQAPTAVSPKTTACKVPLKIGQSRASSPSPRRPSPTRETQCNAGTHGRRSSPVAIRRTSPTRERTQCTASGKAPEQRQRISPPFLVSSADHELKDALTIRPSAVRAQAACEASQGATRTTSPAPRIEMPCTSAGNPKIAASKQSPSARNPNLSPKPRPTSPTPANSGRGKATAPPLLLMTKLSTDELEMREAEAYKQELKRLQEKNARCVEKMSRQCHTTQQRQRKVEEKEVQKEQKQGSRENVKEKVRFTQASAGAPFGEVQRAVIKSDSVMKSDSAKEKEKVIPGPSNKEARAPLSEVQRTVLNKPDSTHGTSVKSWMRFTNCSPDKPGGLLSSEIESCNISMTYCEEMSENDQLEKRPGVRPVNARKRRSSAPGSASSNSVVPERIESVLGF